MKNSMTGLSSLVGIKWFLLLASAWLVLLFCCIVAS